MPKMIKLSVGAVAGLLAVFFVYQLLELRLELEKTREQLAATETRLADRTVENEALTADLGTAMEQLAGKTAEHETLLREVGRLEAVRNEKDTLLAQVESLQDEIARLEEQREPLIVESSRGGFYCTGSMEPKITCLDEATWLDNFRPQDIVVGTVISFTPTAECNLSGVGSVAHRVIDIKGEAGVYYYWPRGDANSSDDGCWIPQDNVGGYIIELHKNVRPENQALRDMVNSASAARDQAEAILVQARQDYEEKQETYDQKYLQYCGSGAGTCTLPPVLYNEVMSLYEAYQSAYDAWQQAYAAYMIANDAWRQAYDLALSG